MEKKNKFILPNETLWGLPSKLFTQEGTGIVSSVQSLHCNKSLRYHFNAHNTKDKKLQRTGKLKKHAMFIMKHQLWKCPTCTWELSSFSYVPMEKLVLSESTKLKEDNKNRHSYPWWCRLIYYHKLFRFPKVENRILLYHNVFWGKRIKEIQQSSTHYTSISPPPPFL